MKKTLSFLAGAVSYIILSLFLSAYEHLHTHTGLNQSIVNKYLSEVRNTSFAKGKFSNYEFNWSSSTAPLLEGPEYSGEGKVTVSEVDKKHTPIDWIIAGGWMEDNPWGPAALKHFYDPVAIDGVKYLTDRASYFETLALPVSTFYKLDAKTWVNSLDNIYGWNAAKNYFTKALQLKDAKDKERNMALAYRSLGQALHLLADMGCPSHVRNDSHPPKSMLTLGDPDIYEELCKTLDASALTQASQPSQTLVQQFVGTEEFNELFEEMAKYTNRNYVTNQTIYSDRHKPAIRSSNPYPNPYLAEGNYRDPGYYRMIDGQNVLLAKDRGIVVPLIGDIRIGDRKEPFVDKECVVSMANALFPNILQAGLHALRMFVPPLIVEISTAMPDSGGIIRGTVKYEPKQYYDEYMSKIDPKDCYNGPITLTINGTKSKITADAVKNAFEFKLKGTGVEVKKDDKIVVAIEMPGITIKSDEKKVGDSAILQFIKSCKRFTVRFRVDYRNSDGSTGREDVQFYNSVDYPINWNQNAFSYTATKSSGTEQVSGTLFDTGNIATFSGKRGIYTIELENVPYGEWKSTEYGHVLYYPASPKNYVKKFEVQGSTATYDMNTLFLTVYFFKEF